MWEQPSQDQPGPSCPKDTGLKINDACFNQLSFGVMLPSNSNLMKLPELFLIFSFIPNTACPNPFNVPRIALPKHESTEDSLRVGVMLFHWTRSTRKQESRLPLSVLITKSTFSLHRVRFISWLLSLETFMLIPTLKFKPHWNTVSASPLVGRKTEIDKSWKK